MAQALYTLKVTLTSGRMSKTFMRDNPVVSRTIQIRADQTLNQLHGAIFKAFGRWDNCHLGEFNFGSGVTDEDGDRFVSQFASDVPDEPGLHTEKPAVGVMEQARIDKLALQVGQEFWYWYDFGDNWVHRITVRAIGEAKPNVKYPRVTSRVGKNPPQYMDWDKDMDDAEADGDDAQSLEQLVAAGGVEEGTMPFPDGSEVPWRHELMSVDEADRVVAEMAGRTYRVMTLQNVEDGKCVIGTYLVPGLWLNVCIMAMASGESEMVLSIEPV
jgi:hypothetical protein